MAFDGNGTFNRIMNWVQDAAAGIKIVADRHDQQDDDFASGLSNCLTKDGQTQPTANIPMNGRKITALGDPTAATDAANKKYVDALKAFSTGLEISGANANGRLKFTSTTGSNGLSFTGADLSWLARLAGTGTLNRLVLNTKPDGSGTDVIIANDDGSLVASNVAATAELQLKPATGDGVVQWYALNGTTKRMSLSTAAGSASDGILTVGANLFKFGQDKHFRSPGRLYAVDAYVDVDGAVVGTKWNAWGSTDAFTAISARIDARAAHYADDRVSRLQYRKVTGGNSGTNSTFTAPTGAVLTGYKREGGNAGQVNYVVYEYLQAYDPVRGWVGFQG